MISKTRAIISLAIVLVLAGLIWLDNRPEASPVTTAPQTGESTAPETAAIDPTGDDAAEPAPEAVITNPLASFDLATLSETVKRPLFASGRRRPSAEQPAASADVDPKKEAPNFELLGVARDGDRAIAVMRKKLDGTSFRVEVGDMLGGWQVSKVEPKSVRLERPDGEVEDVPLFRE